MKLSRLRVGFQVLLHVVLIGHVVAYYWLDWRQLGGLDFQSFFHHFLGEGLLTAGAVLALACYGSALVFGRLFCSWGCHFGATQDFAAWVLRRLGWRPPVVRTRFLHLLSFFFLAVVFVVPVLERLRSGAWTVAVDLAAEGPWDRLPGVALSLVTFAACGLGILLFAGTRGFCRFVCPYGAMFRLTDHLAPFKVRRVESRPCGGECVTRDSTVPPCTAACPTAIDVHRETRERGVVVSTDCVRCNLCIEACPQGALEYRAGPLSPDPPSPDPPSPDPLSRGPSSSPPVAASLPVWGEALVLAVTVATYFAVDLVYGGHFLAATMALGEGFLVYAVVAGAVARERGRAITVLGRPFRAGGSLTLLGVTLIGALALSCVPIFEAAAFKWLRAAAVAEVPESLLGEAEADRQPSPAIALGPSERRGLARAAAKLERALAYFPSDRLTRRLLLRVWIRLGDPRAVELAESLFLADSEVTVQARELLRWVYLRFKRFDQAAQLGGEK